MPLADWDHDPGSNTTFGIQAASPITGTASLEVENLSGAANGQYTTNLSNAFSRGFTIGRIRSLMRFNSASGTPVMQLWCMASTLGAKTNDSYGVAVALGSVNNIELRRNDSGLQSGFTVFGTHSQSLSIGQVIPVELEWNLNIAAVGGIVLFVRTGNVGDLDYTNLALRIAFTDFSAFTVATSEGLHLGSPIGSSSNVSFDETEIFSGA